MTVKKLEWLWTGFEGRSRREVTDKFSLLEEWFALTLKENVYLDTLVLVCVLKN